MATCVPVRMDDGQWQAAFFLQLSGAQSSQDRRIMRQASGPLAMGMETDVVNTDHGAVVVMRPELHTRAEDPLVMEILLTPGAGGAHHEALRLLGAQPTLSWLYGDAAGWVIHAQSMPLGPAQHAGFTDLLAGALRHDTLVRLSAVYDASAALAEVVRHYALRAGAPDAP